MSDFIYILEMVVQTIDGTMNEPLGAYSSEKEAEQWLKRAQKTFVSENVVFNILPLDIDKKPPILSLSEQVKERGMIYQLIELYDRGIFEQMVEQDGSFSYQLKDKYKNSLEKIISKRFDHLK